MNKRTLFIISLLSISSLVKAQTPVSSNELFKNARDAAFEDKNYDLFIGKTDFDLTNPRQAQRFKTTERSSDSL